MIEKLNRLGDMHSDLHVGDNGSNCKLPLVPVRHLYFHPVPEFVLKYLERLRINCVLETYTILTSIRATHIVQRC